jgi:hypothetical protein
MGEPETQLTVVGSQHLAPWTPRFALTVDEAVALVEQKREFMRRVMREGEHFGTIPGTPKPTLYKPGAELLLSVMGLHSDSSINTVPPVVDLLGTEHGGEAFVMFQKTCEIYREEIAGERILIARASANCSSWEKKYRYRKADRTCPACGKVGTVIKGKAEYGGGWLCWKNKGGCGAKFTDTDKRITEQAAGDIPNPDIADVSNTVEKIAAKRALVAATLLATGCSDIFTQDLEDSSGGSDEERGPAVDQDGVISNPSPASRAAQQEAQSSDQRQSGAQDSPPATAIQDSAVAVTSEPPSASEKPKGGPRAKRGNVIQAPQAAEKPKVALETEPPPVDLDEGEAVYLAELRHQARTGAAALRRLRVIMKNTEAALNGQPQAAVPDTTPNADSDESLRVFIEGKFGVGQTLDKLTETDLAAVVNQIDTLIKRVEASGVK